MFCIFLAVKGVLKTSNMFEAQAAAFCLNVVVLSIDIVLNAKLGDLTSDDAVANWVNLLIAGKIVGVLGGPPCETWCAARFLSLSTSGTTALIFFLSELFFAFCASRALPKADL